MDLNLFGKRALICGSSQGIGRACAEELAKLGADVVCLARTQVKLEEVVRHLVRTNRQHHHYLVADLSQRDVFKQLVVEDMKKYGPIHILINNTGGPAGGMITEATEEQLQQALEGHLLASFALTQLLLPGMKEAGYGRIINILSTSVKTPLPHLGVSNTVRWAVASWAKTLAGEVAAYGITVNNVLPGATETERLSNLMKDRSQKEGRPLEEEKKRWRESIPAGRFGRPEEVAAVVGFLSAPAASYVNGVALAVDGGRTNCL